MGVLVEEMVEIFGLVVEDVGKMFVLDIDVFVSVEVDCVMLV